MRKLYFTVINYLFGWMFTKEKTKEQATIEIIDLIKYDNFKPRSIEKQLELIDSIESMIHDLRFNANKKAKTVVRLTTPYLSNNVNEIEVKDVDIFEPKSVSVVEMEKQ